MKEDVREWVQGREGIRAEVRGVKVTLGIMIIVMMQKIKKKREE